MVKNKEQWDYVGNFRIGEDIVIANRPLYARWINPFTGEVKELQVKTDY